MPTNRRRGGNDHIYPSPGLDEKRFIVPYSDDYDDDGGVGLFFTVDLSRWQL
jgi:hypothetical protein